MHAHTCRKKQGRYPEAAILLVRRSRTTGSSHRKLSAGQRLLGAEHSSLSSSCRDTTLSVEGSDDDQKDAVAVGLTDVAVRVVHGVVLLALVNATVVREGSVVQAVVESEVEETICRPESMWEKW